MIASLLLFLAATSVVGYATSSLVCPRLPRAVRLSLSFGLGQGLTSCLAFLWLRAFGSFGYYLPAELALTSCLVAYYLARRRAGPARAAEPSRPRPPPVLLAVSFAAVAACALTFIIFTAFDHPHGCGDAWFIYNLRARMIYRGGEYLSPLILWSHPNYPPMLPLSVVRGWVYLGGESGAVGASLSVLFTLSGACVLMTALAHLRGRALALLAGLLYFAYEPVWTCGWCQVADLPLASFFVSALALTAFHFAGPHRDTLALAGVMALLAAWTKNEGIPFAGWSALLVALTCGRAALRYAAGAAPVAGVLLFFKASAPPSELAASALTFSGVTDPQRVTMILREAGRRLWFRPWHGLSISYLLPAFLIVAGMRLNRAALFGAALLCLMLATYFWVYLTTPYDLAWHLDTSSDRLLLQLWPCFLLSTMLAVDEPREAQPRDV